MSDDPNLEVFRQAISPLSPLTLNGKLPDGMLLVKEHVRARANIGSARQPTISNGTMPDIDFHFIDGVELNAIAFESGGRAYIGVHSGAVFLTHDLFLRMLSHPEILPRIGNASAERVGPWHSQGLMTDYSKLSIGRPAGCTLDAIAPRDPTRREFAYYLARIAMDFIVFHEFGHIRNGHCRYVSALKGNSFISEGVLSAGAGASNGIDPLTRQVIELDADAFAANMTLMLTTTDTYNRPLDHYESRVCDWCFAIMSFFWMWGLGTSAKTILADPYPPPAFRFH
jgi:hypothetical protein